MVKLLTLIASRSLPSDDDSSSIMIFTTLMVAIYQTWSVYSLTVNKSIVCAWGRGYVEMYAIKFFFLKFFSL